MAQTSAIVSPYTLPKSILEKIWLERLRQKQLLREGRIFFACDSPVVSHDRKLRVLTEELGEVAGAIDRIENFNPMRQPRVELSEPSARARKNLCDELTQVAAVAIAWLESLQTSPGSAGVPPASSGGVSPPEETRGGTPRKLAAGTAALRRPADTHASAPILSPEGTSDNSPAFQRWVKRDSVQVPKGRQTRPLPPAQSIT